MFGFGKRRQARTQEVVFYGKRSRAVGNPYTHHYGYALTNGAQEFAFEMPWDTPAQPANGAGFLYRSLAVMQHPQVWQNLNSPVNGLGGLQAGQLFTQPLTTSDYQPIE